MSAPNQLSFLPDDYLERKAQRRTNVLCAILFLVVMGVIGTAFTYSERTMRDLEKQYSEVERDYADAAKRIEQVQQMQAKQRTMAQQAELTKSLLEKVPRSNLLAEITNSMPATVSLLDFSLESRRRSGAAAAKPKTAFEAKKAELEAKGKPAEIEPQRSDVYMRLTGIASTDVQVAQFMSKLLRSSLFREVNLVVSEESVALGEKLRKFQIEMMLDPEAEVIPATKDTKTAAVEIREPDGK